MESHPECSVCIHAADMVSAKTGKIVKRMGKEEDQDFGFCDAIDGLGSNMATNSVLYRADLIPKKMNLEKSYPVQV